MKADDQTIILNLGRDGKLQARTSSWEDPKVSRDGDRLESALQQGLGAGTHIAREPAAPPGLPPAHRND